MSDLDDGSVFEMDASDFEPKPLKAKAPAKTAAKKASAPKSKAAKQTTLKTTTKAAPKSKKRAKPDSDAENSDDDDNDPDSLHDSSLLADTPPQAKKQKKAPAKKASKPLSEVENESFIMGDDVVAKTPPARKGNQELYQKLTQKEHILKRPDTYIGSVEFTTEQMWVFNSETESMENRKVDYVPGLYKIFDEILVNASDNKQNDKNMNEMRVWVDREKGVIAVKNNGRGIPIEMHKKEGIYIPEMIFGHLLTGSNYDDNEAKITGGRNGYGAKLTNIYSTEFSLDTVDSRSKQRYRQTWRNNMDIMEKAKIDSIKKGEEDYTKVTFKPDFSKFGMDKMDDDFEALVKRRVYDMAGTSKGVKVYLNDQRIKVTKFKQYMEMHTKALAADSKANDGTVPEQVILTDNPHERWEIGFAVSDGSFQQVSFVNSIATSHGGTHVNYIADQICEKLEASVNKKNKGGVKLKKAQIKNHIFLFVNCQIVNPAFTSQTKEQLTTKISAFGSKPTVSDKFLNAIAKTEAVNNILHFAQQKADKLLSKSDGSRRARMNNSKLTDANKAGTKDGHLCTLILTEGDSASVLALAGRAVVNPDLFGVFPLRGKMLNVRDATIDQISKNEEIQNIKKFMGLQHKKDYSDTRGLRYGHIMIMTDQDHDGSHIKGLLINFLTVQYPSLLKIPGFLMEFITPIVKVWKGDPKDPKAKRDFFTMPEYEAWKQIPGNQKGWDHKYYKGLGTSNTRDAQIYFADLDRHMKEFHTLQAGDTELIELAFAKKKADERKTWLANFVPGTYLDMSGRDLISYDDFINKELILFSIADNLRSIPNVLDGFKPTHRKIMYTCFRRNLKKDIKVVELAGTVSGLTAYAHGEASMQSTIVGLAQNHVGSNNINLLEPSGNFGSRLQGGNDAASARYIYTRLSPFARKVFHPADDALLTYNTDDNKTIEPETYIPIIPMLLVNGADGIGTGWSTSIPNYKPIDIIENLKRRMDGEGKEDMHFMTPWFRGWTGQMESTKDGQFRSSATLTITGTNEIEITELPVRYWTQDFKEKLETILKADKSPSFIKDYTEYNTPETVHFIIKLEEKKMEDTVEKLIDLFKLTKTFSTTNLTAFDAQGRIHKYATPLDIMEEFYQVRLQTYLKRKKHLLDELSKELDKLTNQAKFVKLIIDGKLVVSKKKKAALVSELASLNFTRFPKVADAKKQNELEEVVEEDNDDSDDAVVNAGANDFDYLLGMAIWSLTQERVEKLTKQIGEKEAEIDILNSKSAKDLWREDLDELEAEWEFQLDQEAKREKKIRSKGRRDSKKLGIKAKGGKKRKAGEDSDFDDSDFQEKKKPKGAATKKLMGGVDELLSKHAKGPEAFPVVNGIEQKPVVRPAGEQLSLQDSINRASAIVAEKEKAKPKAKAAASNKVVELSDDDDEDVFAAVAKEASSKPAAKPARGGRAAAQKTKTYKVESDEDEDSDGGNNMLEDVSTMVKGIGSGAGEVASRLFHGSTSSNRPSSAHGLKAKPSLKKVSDQMDISDNETDWAALAQNSPQKATKHTIMSDDDDLMDIDKVVPPKAAPKAAGAKAKAVPKAKETTLKPKKTAVPAVAAAPKPLSPAAKAYAAKQAKAAAAKGPSKIKKSIDSDEDMDDDDDLANEIISDDEDDSPVKPAARPARRTAAAKPKSKYVVDDDEDEDEESASDAEMDDEDDTSF